MQMIWSALVNIMQQLKADVGISLSQIEFQPAEDALFPGRHLSLAEE